MDLKRETGTRRRGAELEDAILEAAWAELTENGYAAFTFESIAARAGTSRPVLYRRWSDRDQLMLAAIDHERARNPIQVPDTGNLRDDIVILLQRVSAARAGFAALMSAQLNDYFRATGTTFFELKRLLQTGPQGGDSTMDLILDRAAARGEIDPSVLDTRTIELPATLMRYELLVNLKRSPDSVIEEIVDDIWMPLLRAKGALREKA
ncbi:MAG: TetR/AcrR family transcriptional regulator [Pseudolysinimonas sp.]|uniref:TetR/AcrR family transcriptional regulator n=1 Tax=Pseudolysinimonas sp. TaxID=2680009 RepID=UPI003266538B